MGLFSVNFIISQINSVLIVLYSLILRKFFSIMGRKVRFASKTSELLFIIYIVCLIYTLNYTYMYLYGPFYHETNQAKEQNAQFIPYG